MSVEIKDLDPKTLEMAKTALTIMCGSYSKASEVTNDFDLKLQNDYIFVDGYEEEDGFIWHHDNLLEKLSEEDKLRIYSA